MSTPYQKPEYFLKKAEDLILLDKKEIAVDVLLELLKGRRNRAWTQVLELAAVKLLEICIILNNSMVAKETIYQYKNICQNGNANSFDEVVKTFLKNAENGIETIKSKASDQQLVDDLDQSETPETVLAKASIISSQRDKVGTISLTSAVKFCWESYRNTLEMSKNNKFIEKVYVDTGLSAMKFCEKYSRRMEFRKLCDMTRSHLQIIFRGYNSTCGIELSDPNSLQLQMSLRLSQLDVAITSELWLEAYKTMEEVYELIRISRKLPKPSMLAHFYQQTSLVFFKGNSYLFHAIIVHKLFILVKEQKKNVSREELSQISNKALMASLSVPHLYDLKDYQADLEYEEQVENIAKLTSFLKLSAFPTRKSIISEMIQLSILKYADESLVQLYDILEGHSTDVLLICRKTHQILSSISEELQLELNIYFDSIHDIAFRTMLTKLSTIYSRVTMKRLLSLTPYYKNRQTLSNKLLESGRSKLVSISIDDETDSVILHSVESKSGNYFNQSTLSGGESIINFLGVAGPVLKMSRFICDQESGAIQELEQEKKRYIQYFRENDLLAKRVKAIKENQDLIMQCTQAITQRRNEKEKEEQLKIEQKQQQIVEQERVREEEEKNKREERRKLELEEVIKKQAMKKVEILRKENDNSTLKKILTGTTMEEVVQDPVKFEILKNELKKKEIDKKLIALKATEKKLDHRVRAFRMAEASKYAIICPENSKCHQEYCTKVDTERSAAFDKKQKEEEATRNRLTCFRKYVDQFVCDAALAYDVMFEQKKLNFLKVLAEERIKALEKRRDNYTQEKKTKFMENNTLLK